MQVQIRAGSTTGLIHSATITTAKAVMAASTFDIACAATKPHLEGETRNPRDPGGLLQRRETQPVRSAIEMLH